MIARQGHGRVPAAKAVEYLDYLERRGLFDHAATPGNRGVIVFRRTENGVTHFLLTTPWESWEAIELAITLKATTICSSASLSSPTSKCRTVNSSG